MSDLRFSAIGTSWHIDLPKVSEAEAQKIFTDISERIAVFDRNYSRFRSDSLVMKMAEHPGEYILPDDAKPMMDLYRKLYEITDGKMTPTIGTVLSDVGYDASYTLRPKDKIFPAKRWDDVMVYDFPVLVIKEPVILDFGAIGKGYLIDIVGAMLDHMGIGDYMIDAGGDILYKNSLRLPLRIGLEDANDAKKAIGVAEISAGAFCGSAGNRRAWSTYHHIIDPDKVESPRHIDGLWVAAHNAMTGDALTTALYFVSPEKLLPHFDFEYVMLFPDRSVELSKHFPGTLFTL